MSGRGETKRHIWAHRLPMSLPYAPPAPRHGPQAAFLAQLLSAAPAGQPQAIRPETPAHSAYRSAEASDQRRMPKGFRKTLSA